MRDESVNGEIYYAVRAAKVLIEGWWQAYNLPTPAARTSVASFPLSHKVHDYINQGITNGAGALQNPGFTSSHEAFEGGIEPAEAFQKVWLGRIGTDNPILRQQPER
jgi:hypothetical protein